MSAKWRVAGSLISLALASASTMAQSSLTIEEAVGLARRNNGAIRAAQYAAESAKSRERFDFGAYLPSVTPQYRYDRSRVEQNGARFDTNEGFPSVVASWKLLDSGERDLTYRSSKALTGQAESTSIQTLRNTLFLVRQQFLNALRAQELLKVRQASVDRAAETLRATEARIAAKQAADIERLQANADFQNSKVDFLSATNDLSNARSLLKATIGWNARDGEPTLTAVEPLDESPLGTLEEVIRDGLSAREDLRARRFGIEAQRLSLQQTRRESGVTFSLDANYTRNWSDAELDSKNLTLLASVPLYNGNRSRELVRQSELNLASLKASLQQDERDAAAEIESAYLALKQNRERLAAARVALEAATVNYQAAIEAQRLGAEGTNVISVLTAKISLVTAESNAVAATYDVYISDAQLKLVTGRPVPNETL